MVGTKQLGTIIDVNAPKTSIAAKVLRELALFSPFIYVPLSVLSGEPGRRELIVEVDGNLVHVQKEDYHSHLTSGERVEVDSKVDIFGKINYKVSGLNCGSYVV